MASMESQEEPMDEDTEQMTSSEVLTKLEEAWLNEKFAPELLEHKMDYVECLLELLHQMETNVNRLPKGDLRRMIHTAEIDRIRYIISSYLRCRLTKIQEYTAHVLKREREASGTLLSPEELTFATEYLESIQNHLHILALRHMPAVTQSVDLEKTMPTPENESFVFFKAQEDVPGVLIDGDADTSESIIDIQKNSQHFTKYKTISNLVKSGEVILI